MLKSELERLRLYELARAGGSILPAYPLESMRGGAGLERVMIVNSLHVLDEYALRPEGVG